MLNIDGQPSLFHNYKITENGTIFQHILFNRNYRILSGNKFKSVINTFYRTDYASFDPFQTSKILVMDLRCVKVLKKYKPLFWNVERFSWTLHNLFNLTIYELFSRSITNIGKQWVSRLQDLEVLNLGRKLFKQTLTRCGH